MAFGNNRRFSGDGRRLDAWRGGGGAASGIQYILDPADGTFTRSSEASQYGNFVFDDGADDLGTMVWRSANQARIYADGSILIEGARTNQCTDSEAIAGTGWTTDSSVADQVAAPDGTVDADLYDGTHVTRPWWGTATGGTVNSVAVFLRGNGAAGTVDLGVDTYAASAAETVAFPASTWARRTVTTSVGGSAFCTFDAGTQDFHPWGAQVETQAAFPTSYIRTSGATATRTAEALSWASGAWDTRIATGQFAFDYWPCFGSSDTASGNQFYILDVAGAGTGLFRFEHTGGNLRVQMYGGTGNNSSSAITFSRYQKLTFAIDHAAGTYTVSGATTGNGTVAAPGATTWTHASNGLNYGCSNSSTLQVFGRLSKIRAGTT